jgi:hypothetical protein
MTRLDKPAILNGYVWLCQNICELLQANVTINFVT